MSKRFYICENEFGPDPCEFAKANRKIPESEVSFSVGSANPKCPGKTLSGTPCNSELRGPYKEKGGIWEKICDLFTGKKLWITLIAGAILLLLVGIVFLIRGCQGQPLMSASPNPLVFPLSKSAKKTADINIGNSGDGELIISRIETRPSVFSVSGGEVRVDPNGATKLPVRFESQSNEIIEGELVLHSNDKNSPTTIKLIANRDPWWVFRKLETTSKILQKEP